MLQLTRAMAIDHAREGIRINAVCPDNVDTPMLAGEARQLGEDPAAYLKVCDENIPLGHIATPEEVADIDSVPRLRLRPLHHRYRPPRRRRRDRPVTESGRSITRVCQPSMAMRRHSASPCAQCAAITARS